MEILKTDVSWNELPNGVPMIRVGFHGEGGEAVTVHMSPAVDGAYEPDHAIIDRAKGILVQVATFEMPGAESHPDTETENATSSNDAGEVFVFEYRDGDRSRTLPPSTLPHLQSAREEAVRSAIDLLPDLRPGTDDLTGWLVRVRDGGGKILTEVDVAQAQEAQKRALAET